MKWLPWLIFALFGFFLVGTNFSAKLGMIDDHEIAMFLGGDGEVKVSEIVPTIMSTEVGQWGSYLRYRPSYYTLRVLETALWRDNAALWYFSRYLMLVVSMWLGWKIIILYFPKIVGYMFVFYAMTMPFWPDLLTRLGPSEIYTVPALLLFVYGLTQNKVWMIAVGYAVCVGAKENFLVLFPVLLGWAGNKVINKKITKQELWTTIVLSVFTLSIAGAILTATAKAGADIYGKQIGYRYRITKFVWDIPKIVMSRHMLPALGVLLAGTLLSWKKVRSSKVIKHVGLMFVILAMIASQYIFYINQLPSNTRYDFPALLLFPVLDLVALHAVVTYFAKHRYSKIIKLGVYAVIILISTAYIAKRGYVLIQQQAKRSALVTQSFQNSLTQAEEKIKSEPNAKLIFVSERFIDFEPIVSVSRYLNSRKIGNEFMLYYRTEASKQDPMELDDRLKQVMEGELGEDGIFDRFSAYQIDDQPCYSITFGEAVSHSSCQEIAKF